MTDDDTERSSESNPHIEKIDFEAAQRGMRTLNEIEPILTPKPRVRHRHPRSFKRRSKLLRAAFIGSATIPFSLVIIIGASCVGGWIGSAYFYNALQAEKLENTRHKAVADAWLQLTTNLAQIREDADENEYYLKAWDEAYRRIEIIRKTSSQDQ